MKRLVPTLSIALLLLVASGAVFAEPAPKATVLEPIQDFEFVPQGEHIAARFEIRNDGDATLRLTNVNPACGCTVVDFDESIAPGAIGTVEASVETQDFSGPIAKSVAVFTNDPANPKLQLVIKANVKPFLKVFPGYARYNYVQGEYVEGIPQNLWSEDDTDLQVLEVKSTSGHIHVGHRLATEAERDPQAAGKKQWRIDVELDPAAPVGALRDFVEVKTNHPKQPLTKIPVSGFVRPRQHVTPQTVEFGSLSTDLLPVKRQLAMTNFITDAITIRSVETGLEHLSAEVTEVKNNEGHRFRVLMTLGEGMPAGSFSSVVKIRTSDKKSPIVEIPVSGIIETETAVTASN